MLIEKGSIVSIEESPMSIKGNKVVYHTLDCDIDLYLGIIPEENIVWFKGTTLGEGALIDLKLKTTTMLVALVDFCEDYTKNIFSIKHLRTPMEELIEREANGEDVNQILRDCLHNLKALESQRPENFD